MRVLGIDPGQKGGIVLYNSVTKEVEGAWPMPVHKIRIKKSGTKQGFVERKEIDLPGIEEVFQRAAEADTDLVVLEKVKQRPTMFHKNAKGETVTSAQTGLLELGVAWGIPRAMIQAFRLRYEGPPPSTWKRDIRAPADKDLAVTRADELLPKFQKLWRGPRGANLDGVAEAALLALWGAEKWKQ